MRRITEGTAVSQGDTGRWALGYDPESASAPARILLADSVGLASALMLDPAYFAAPAMRAALGQRDISRVYRLLNDAGVPQRTIAELTGQSQSEVSEIIQGRRVQSYDVLVRIYAGLGVPREVMQWSFGAYPGDGSVSEPGEEDEADVLRRQFDNLFALAVAAAMGTVIPGLGRLSGSVLPSGQLVAVPARIGRADVETIHDLTRAVAVAARTVGGQAGPACSMAEWADRCLAAEASDVTRQALLCALADLHVIAAWCCHDSHAPVEAHQHFSRAVELATQAGDHYRASYALRHAAAMLIDRDQPNNALKLTQLAELHLADASRDDPRVAPLRCELVVVGALAQAQLADPGFAPDARRIRSELARSQDGWDPPSLHGRAGMDLFTSWAHLRLGALDIAESMAAVAVRTFAEGNYGREGVLASITVARLHLITGEPDAGRLAAQAIEAVSPLRSGVARTRLAPLALDLETRSRPGFAELAHRAHQIATTRI